MGCCGSADLRPPANVSADPPPARGREAAVGARAKGAADKAAPPAARRGKATPAAASKSTPAEKAGEAGKKDNASPKKAHIDPATTGHDSPGEGSRSGLQRKGTKERMGGFRFGDGDEGGNDDDDGDDYIDDAEDAMRRQQSAGQTPEEPSGPWQCTEGETDSAGRRKSVQFRSEEEMEKHVWNKLKSGRRASREAEALIQELAEAQPASPGSPSRFSAGSGIRAMLPVNKSAARAGRRLSQWAPARSNTGERCPLFPKEEPEDEGMLTKLNRMLKGEPVTAVLDYAEFHDVMQAAAGAAKKDAGCPVLEVTAGELPVTVVGDIHGQVSDLLHNVLGPVLRKEKPHCRWLFLGDLVDRGPQSCAVLATVALMKVCFPACVYILRGNHEDAPQNFVYGFFNECESQFGQMTSPATVEAGVNHGATVWHASNMFFSELPLAALVREPNSGEQFFCAHGGLTPALLETDDVAGLINGVNRAKYGKMAVKQAELENAIPVSPVEESGERPEENEDRPKGTEKTDVLTKSATEKMGMIWMDETILEDVIPGNAADRCGLSKWVGWRLIAINGGAVETLKDIATTSAGATRMELTFFLEDPDTDLQLIQGLLWSDPIDHAKTKGAWDSDSDEEQQTQEDMFQPNLRGAGELWSETATTQFCKRTRTKFVCRAHQQQRTGYRWAHDKRVLTVFSASNYCGLGNEGAVLYVKEMKGGGLDTTLSKGYSPAPPGSLGTQSKSDAQTGALMPAYFA